jgi:hypothetical protein
MSVIMNFTAIKEKLLSFGMDEVSLSFLTETTAERGEYQTGLEYSNNQNSKQVPQPLGNWYNLSAQIPSSGTLGTNGEAGYNGGNFYVNASPTQQNPNHQSDLKVLSTMKASFKDLLSNGRKDNNLPNLYYKPGGFSNVRQGYNGGYPSAITGLASTDVGLSGYNVGR